VQKAKCLATITIQRKKQASVFSSTFIDCTPVLKNRGDFLLKSIVGSVLTGASRPEQILDNIKAIQNTTFTADELARIDQISIGND